jgi:hypothetical protein
MQAFGGFFHWIAELSTKSAKLPPTACRLPKLMVIRDCRFGPEALYNYKLLLKIKERE